MKTINNKEKFSKLFDKHHSNLYNYAIKVLKERDLAEEIVQETFIRLWENIEKIEERERSVQSYLIITFKNKLIDYYRKKKVKNKHVGLYAQNRDVSLEIDTVWELSNSISLVYTTLPTKTREIFQLSRDKGLSYKEIATKKNISVKTVELHISKALIAFRKGLSGYL